MFAAILTLALSLPTPACAVEYDLLPRERLVTECRFFPNDGGLRRNVTVRSGHDNVDVSIISIRSEALGPCRGPCFGTTVVRFSVTNVSTDLVTGIAVAE